ncbi:tripartite motif-containing protein 5-like [Heterocephalus glaber]|uniref:Tripartite motif-containing protein 5-like n=1 Tax=Heterocephalus glaber TaxID=10181 RepID=A0AAX6QU79_HETGA|nr:tripartite motif-containing protein 5-like [Heterocephalus glaber]
MEMLQDVKVTMERSKSLTPKKPKTFPKINRMVLQAPDLKRMLQIHQEQMEVRRYWAHLTLTPSINPDIAISANRQKLRLSDPLQTSNSQRGSLGYPAVTSGKHYWEVDVAMERDWILGVSDGKYLNTSFKFNDENYQPKHGYWVIGQQNDVKYNAFEESYNSDPLTLALSLTVPPKRVGIFLDYEARTVSFYNVTNHGFLIHKFSRCSFSGNVFPFFSPRICVVPMPLCGPKA